MAKVVFPDSFLSYTDGVRETTTDTTVYRDLVRELVDRWPDLNESLQKSAVAIDGHIHQDAFLEQFDAQSELFFMSRIEGG